jgi:IS30 family transposase
VVRRNRSGRRAKLAPEGLLFAEVTKLLRLQWSPEQIAGRRQRMEEGAEVSSGLPVSHEAIYQAIYAVPRGELRRELLAGLRQGKPHRGRRPKDGERRGRICDMTSIRERPAEVEGRLVPGHWEGDLIKGAGNRSSVGTLVERTSRKVILITLADAKAETARDGFAAGLLAIPAPLRLTLTDDQGKEMARHKELSALTGLQVYFADPHAPWQRGSNENTNGLLRQYLPKGSDLSVFAQAELDAIAARLNGRPRKTLGFATPDEVFAGFVDKAANTVTSRNAESVRYGT